MIGSKVTSFFTYSAPNITRVQGCVDFANTDSTKDCLPAGGDEITITGSNFGPPGAAAVSVAGNACTKVTLDSNAQAATVCANEAGICTCTGTVYYMRKFKKGTTIPVSFEERSSLSHKIWLSATKSSCDNFIKGDPDIGLGKSCWCVPAPTHRSLTCTTPQGSGMDVAVSVVLGEPPETTVGSANLLSYKGPLLTDGTLSSNTGTRSFDLNGWSLVRASNDAAQRAAEELSLFGENLGEPDDVVSVHYQSDDSGVTFPCVVQSRSSSQITCKPSLDGAGLKLRFVVTVNGIASPMGNDKYSYPAPSITPETLRNQTGVGAANYDSATTIGERMYFDGTFLSADVSLLSVSYGPPSDPTQYVCYPISGCCSVTKICCTTSQGVGSGLVFRVLVGPAGNQEAANGTDTYNYPVAPFFLTMEVAGASKDSELHITDVPTSSLAPSGEPLLLMMKGIYFEGFQLVTVGGRACENLQPVPSPPTGTDVGELWLQCELPAGAGGSNKVVLLANGKVSISEASISYARPVVTAVRGCEDEGTGVITGCARSGGDIVTIEGANFGPDGAHVLIGSDVCAGVAHDLSAAHSILTCSLPESYEPGQMPVVVSQKGVNTGSNADVHVTYESCGPGHELKSNQCGLCMQGKYSPLGDSTSCVRCEPGHFSDDAGAAACLPCSPGRYTQEQGSLSCSACPAGRHAPFPGVVSCLLCEAGHVSSVAESISCSACPAGRYKPEDGDGSVGTSCLDCAPGTFASLPGLTQCWNCAAGEFSAQAASTVCSLCQPGSFRLEAGRTNCTLCEEGKFSSGKGSVNCDGCNVGKFQTGLGASACEDCQPGRKASSPGASNCTECMPGTSTYGLAGLTGCQVCQAGFFAAQSGEPSCSACQPGRFQGMRGQSECSNCSRGTYSIALATLCTRCAKGRFANESGLPLCYQCPRGRIAADAGMEQCVNCPSGLAASQEGQIECDVCPAGRRSTEASAECEACAPGRFKASTGIVSLTCEACGPGRFSGAGAVQCENCPAGSYVSVGPAANCTLCAAGTFQPQERSSTCERCAPSTYAPVLGATSCMACSLGTHTEGRNSSEACVPCAAGFYGTESVVTGINTCEPCPPGSFGAPGEASCKPCKAGRYSNVSNSSSCTLCPAGFQQPASGEIGCRECTVGKYGLRGDAVCRDCSKGRFNNRSAQDHCELCGPGLVAAKGAQACTSCDAGEYAPSAGMSACLPCPKGSFANATRNSQCHACAPGRYQTQAGADSCLPCGSGTFADLPGTVECMLCASGRVADLPEQVSCSLCPAGFESQGDGRTACVPCSPGTYSEEGAGKCSDCPAGFVNDEYNQTTCYACTEGEYSPTAGNVNCTVCSPGYYNPKRGAASCLSCEPGRSMPEGNASQCVPCLEGRAQSQRGSQSCDVCSEGRYSPLFAALECTACEAGRYQPRMGMLECDDCAEGKHQSQQAQMDCQECEFGRFGQFRGMPECVECDPGRVSNNATDGLCQECRPGHFAWGTGKSQCEPCSAGRYAPEKGASECAECDPGSTTSLVGQIECTACQAGYFQTSTGQTECNICPAGKFSGRRAISCSACASIFQVASQPGSSACSDCVTYSFALGARCQCQEGFYEVSEEPSEEMAGVGLETNSNVSSYCAKCQDGLRSFPLHCLLLLVVALLSVSSS